MGWSIIMLLGHILFGLKLGLLLSTSPFMLHAPPKGPEQTQIPLSILSKPRLHPIPPSIQTPLQQPSSTTVKPT